MNFHPAFDVLQKHGIRPVTNSPDGTFTSNCPSCGKLNSNFVHYDDDAVSWHCHDCGDSRIVPLRPAQAKPGGNGAPRDDADAWRKAFEESKGEFPDDDEPEPAPEPEPEPATSDAAEGAPDGSCSHIWQSKDHDYPCTPTGEEQPDDAGRIYARVRTPDGGQSFVPKDELEANSGEEASGVDAGDAGTNDANGSGPQPDNIPPDTWDVICNGVEDDKLRASAFWNVLLVLKRRGFVAGRIIELLETHPNGIAKKYRGRLHDEVRRAYNKIKSDDEEPQPQPLVFVNMSNWDNEPVPEQDWSVLNRIPRKQCVLFSGEGAAGKSTVELHACAAHVLDRDWLGSMPAQGPALFIDAEDDKDVLHRRLAAITAHYGVTFNDLIKGGLHLISLFGQDAVLATSNRNGKIKPTALYDQILEAVGDIKPIMIGIASSANVYAGSEIDRPQVQQFLSLMTRLALVANGSVVLISHPSLTGISSESGISGSTRWHNGVRARFYMKSVKPENGEEPDTDLREIVFKKNNYGPVSESIVLRYQNGLFLPVPGAASFNQAAQEARADEVFLTLLRRFSAENRNVSDKVSSTYAPALFAKEEEAKKLGLTNKHFAAAMRRLFKAGIIWNEPTPDWRPSRPRYRLALKR